MTGHCILSHGLNSSPNASKVSALARVAEAAGWSHERPDYTDLDDGGVPADLPLRVGRLMETARRWREAGNPGPLVLAGSSLGAYTSALASLQLACDGLFLMVPPVRLPEPAAALEAAPVPTQVIHAWHDDLIPPLDVVHWCQQRSARLLMLDDGHRLNAHVDLIAGEFARFLEALA